METYPSPYPKNVEEQAVPTGAISTQQKHFPAQRLLFLKPQGTQGPPTSPRQVPCPRCSQVSPSLLWQLFFLLSTALSPTISSSCLTCRWQSPTWTVGLDQLGLSTVNCDPGIRQA
ncbi:hypothetical protein P7K49_011921, partial [Saguinus oedipus]